jgi:hypothetical protein
LLAADLTEAGPADRPQKLTVEGQAALDRADDEIDVAELGLGDWGRLSATKGPESAISVAIPAAQDFDLPPCAKNKSCGPSIIHWVERILDPNAIPAFIKKAGHLAGFLDI